MPSIPLTRLQFITQFKKTATTTNPLQLNTDVNCAFNLETVPENTYHLSVLAHTCIPSTWRIEVGEREIQYLSRLPSEFKASLVYEILTQKQIK